MITAKLFTNGRSQAVRLPREFRFKEKEVYINCVNGIVMLMPKNKIWDAMAKSLDMFTDDFMSERNQGDEQIREPI